jgi:hypothetical protein
MKQMAWDCRSCKIWVSLLPDISTMSVHAFVALIIVSDFISGCAILVCFIPR